MTSISNAVRDLRMSKQLSINELADRAEVSRSTVQRCEDPTYTNHSVRVLRQIAEVLDARVEVIFRRNSDVGNVD